MTRKEVRCVPRRETAAVPPRRAMPQGHGGSKQAHPAAAIPSGASAPIDALMQATLLCTNGALLQVKAAAKDACTATRIIRGRAMSPPRGCWTGEGLGRGKGHDLAASSRELKQGELLPAEGCWWVIAEGCYVEIG